MPKLLGPHLGYVLAAGFAALLLVTLLAQWLRVHRDHRLASRVAKARATRAIAGEHEAAALLLTAGYKILGRQVPLSWEVGVGDQACIIEIRADLLVEDVDGRVLVAEVKTGEFAPSIYNSATRRQLLEYVIAYEAAGALLIDMEHSTIDEIDFFAGDAAA